MAEVASSHTLVDDVRQDLDLAGVEVRGHADGRAYFFKKRLAPLPAPDLTPFTFFFDQISKLQLAQRIARWNFLTENSEKETSQRKPNDESERKKKVEKNKALLEFFRPIRMQVAIAI